ncbi:glycosyl hydrolase family 18 protein [Natronospora cellulosivora (SeqCode)]
MEKIAFYNKYKKYIITVLLIFILVPFFLITTSTVIYSANLDWAENHPWIRGVLLFLVSIIINNFIGENKEEVPDEPIFNENFDENIDDILDYSTNDNKRREVLGFHVNWLTHDANSYENLKTYNDHIDMVAPFWYTLMPDGSIQSRYGGYQHEVHTFASANNIKMIPLINNNQTNNMILVDPETRKKAVNSVVELVKQYDFDGVNIDFEFIPPWTRNGYTAFMEKLSEKLREMDKLVTISVFPKIDVPSDLHEAYDYAALAPLIDRMLIMTYDHHWSTGPAGPIAPIDWVERNIKYTLEYIPADKLMLGIANYGYDWSSSSERAPDLSEKRAHQLAKEMGVEIQWNNEFQTPYFNYIDDNGEEHEVWFENGNSAAFKFDLVNKYDLRGIGIWRLGNSDDRFWNNVERMLR